MPNVEEKECVNTEKMNDSVKSVEVGDAHELEVWTTSISIPIKNGFPKEL